MSGTEAARWPGVRLKLSLTLAASRRLDSATASWSAAVLRRFSLPSSFNRTRRLARLLGVISLLCMLFPGLLRGGNVLSDPGFEDNPVGADIHPIAGWQWYGQTWNTFTESDGHAHSGTNYFKVFGSFTGSDNYNGIFQDVACTPGSVYSADGWAFSLSADGGGIHGQDQIWIEVTFRDATSNTLALYRSDTITGNNIAAYGGLDLWFNLRVTNQWSFTNNGGLPIAGAVTNTTTLLVAPPGAAFARYQIVFHQGPDNANGSFYFDDCALNQTNPAATAWNIVWSDEFNGTSVNASNWAFETGNNNGWGNGEKEYYTGRSQNASVSGGFLHITAQKEAFGGFDYTSARMKTQNLFTKKYGRIEFRAKMPAGVGFWPALWLLGSNISSVNWPACGEIDIMENKGSVPGQVQGTIHYSDANNNHLQSTALYNFPANNGATNFHTYLLDWATNSIRWYVDGLLYETQTSWSSSTGPYPAPFNQPFFITMNLAVGGAYLGNPTTNTINANTTFPGEMLVDYVRVYNLTAPLQISISQTNGNLSLSWPANIVSHLQAQTNSAGLGTNWFDVPSASNPFTVPLGSFNSNVFYRLKSL